MYKNILGESSDNPILATVLMNIGVVYGKFNENEKAL